MNKVIMMSFDFFVVWTAEEPKCEMRYHKFVAGSYPTNDLLGCSLAPFSWSMWPFQRESFKTSFSQPCQFTMQCAIICNKVCFCA